MLNVQFVHKYTESYHDLKTGDIFTCPDFPGKVFIYTDTNAFEKVNDCVDLTTGNTYSLDENILVLIIKNAKLIVED